MEIKNAKFSSRLQTKISRNVVGYMPFEVTLDPEEGLGLWTIYSDGTSGTRRMSLCTIQSPPTEIIQTAFTVAIGSMPPDVFADWLESYGKSNLTLEVYDEGDGWDDTLREMRTICQFDRCTSVQEVVS